MLRVLLALQRGLLFDEKPSQAATAKDADEEEQGEKEDKSFISLKYTDMYMKLIPKVAKLQGEDVYMRAARFIHNHPGKCVLLVFPLGVRMDQTMVKIAQRVQQAYGDQIYISGKSIKSVVETLATQAPELNEMKDVRFSCQSDDPLQVIFVIPSHDLVEASRHLPNTAPAARTSIVLNWNHPNLFHSMLGPQILNDATCGDWSRIVTFVPTLRELNITEEPLFQVQVDSNEMKTTEEWIENKVEEWQQQKNNRNVHYFQQRQSPILKAGAADREILRDAWKARPFDYMATGPPKPVILFANETNGLAANDLCDLAYATYTSHAQLIVRTNDVSQAIQERLNAFTRVRSRHRSTAMSDLLQKWQSESLKLPVLDQLVLQASWNRMIYEEKNQILFLPQNIRIDLFAMMYFHQLVQNDKDHKTICVIVDSDAEAWYNKIIGSGPNPNLVFTDLKNLSFTFKAKVKDRDPATQSVIVCAHSKYVNQIMKRKKDEALGFEANYIFYTSDWPEMIDSYYRGIQWPHEMKLRNIDSWMLRAVELYRDTDIVHDWKEWNKDIKENWFRDLRSTVLLVSFASTAEMCTQMNQEFKARGITNQDIEIITLVPGESAFGAFFENQNKVSTYRQVSVQASVVREENMWVFVSLVAPEDGLHEIDPLELIWGPILSQYRLCKLAILIQGKEDDVQKIRTDVEYFVQGKLIMKSDSKELHA